MNYISDIFKTDVDVFLDNAKLENGEYSLVGISLGEPTTKSIKEFLEPIEVTYLDNYENEKEFVFTIERCANIIARNSRRARGNNLFFMDGYLYIFFRSRHTGADSPFVINDLGLFVHPNYQKYFAKLKVPETVPIQAIKDLIKTVSFNNRFITHEI